MQSIKKTGPADQLDCIWKEGLHRDRN